MEALIEKIVHGGYGLARIEGGVCFVPFAVPGDVLDIVYSPGKEVTFGWIREIIKPSSYRRESKCPVFGVCGGCDFDNMDYGYELMVKKNILIDNLERIAKLTDVPFDNIVHNKEYWYRNHVQFKVDAKGEVGFFEKKSHEVVALPFEGCRLLQKSINEYVRVLRKRTRFKEGGFRIRTDTDGKIYKKGIPGIENDKHCTYYVEGKRLRINIDDFFQVNNFVVEEWVQRIRFYLEPQVDDHIVDLFCGSGLIALCLAKYAKSVIGIELNINAARSALHNADLNHITNVSFIQSKAETGIRTLKHIDKIILDPPRSGLNDNLIGAITHLKPKVIVYASCDTATFSRDVKQFLEKGYLIDKITLIDMFPRTRHSEVVGRLIPKIYRA